MSSKRDLNKFYFNELHDLVAKPPADSKYLMGRMKGTYRKDDGWCLSIELNWKKKNQNQWQFAKRYSEIHERIIMKIWSVLIFSRLTALDQNLELTLKSVGEGLRTIIGKEVIMNLKDKIFLWVAWSLQYFLRCGEA